MFLPLPLFFVCLCVLIIRGLLACFPDPTLTFLSATEKRGIPPAGTQSKRPGENSNSVHEPLGTRSVSNRQRGGCENYTAAGGSRKPRGPLPPPTHFTDEGHSPRGFQRLNTGSPSFNQSKTTQFFQNCYHKAFFSPGKHSAQKAFPHTKNLQWKLCLNKPTTHENFLITKHLKLQSAYSSHAFIQRVFIK